MTSITTKEIVQTQHLKLLATDIHDSISDWDRWFRFDEIDAVITGKFYVTSSGYFVEITYNKQSYDQRTATFLSIPLWFQEEYKTFTRTSEFFHEDSIRIPIKRFRKVFVCNSDSENFIETCV